MDGVFIIDKPEGMTSHDVVKVIRKKFDTKAGHLGTLDPMATGVLPVCVGKATRMGQFLSNSPKIYTGTIRFGFSTDTYDREGAPTSDKLPLNSLPEEIKKAMRLLTGLLDQTPPPFSAKKIGGIPSHKLARKGRAIEMAAARVEVHEFEMVQLEGPVMTFRVVCSPGTYVRGLAHDLGQRLGCGAHLESLRRTLSGEFGVDQAVTLERVAASNLTPMEDLLASWPRLEVSEADENKVAHGNQFRGEAPPGFARIFNKKGEFIAVAAIENGWVLPRLVLTSMNSD